MHHRLSVDAPIADLAFLRAMAPMKPSTQVATPQVRSTTVRQRPIKVDKAFKVEGSPSPLCLARDVRLIGALEEDFIANRESGRKLATRYFPGRITPMALLGIGVDFVLAHSRLIRLPAGRMGLEMTITNHPPLLPPRP